MDHINCHQSHLTLQGRMDTERAIKEACIKLGHISPQATWRLMDGGRTNTCWHVEGADQVVVKLYDLAATSPLFANDPSAEWECLHTLSKAGMAPKPIAQFDHPLGPILIYEYISSVGRQPTSAEIGEYLKKLHSTPAPLGLPSRPMDRHWIEDKAKEFGLSSRKVAFTPYKSCLLHGDPVIGNFIKSDKVVAIDWQCPAIGDPCDDIGIYLSAGMQLIYNGRPLLVGERSEFWAAYNNEEIQNRFKTLEPIYRACLAEYFKLRGTPEDQEAAELEMQSGQPD